MSLPIEGFMIVMTALVFLMTVPGLALYYGGMARPSAVLTTVMYSLSSMTLVGLIWWAGGYSLAFGPDHGGVIGDLSWAFFSHVGSEPNTALAPGMSHSTFALYQMVFAVITAALIGGAFAERMKLRVSMLFATAWTLLVYCPLAHMLWSPDGLLHKVGALDFAGGMVVHMNAGLAGLVCAIFVGRRYGFPKPAHMHSLMWTMVGAGLLWFGWVGFNVGSALQPNGTAANAFVTTMFATMAAGFAWMVTDMRRKNVRKPKLFGMASGWIAGLVVITPCCGFVDSKGAVAVGLLTGFICNYAVDLKYVLMKYKVGKRCLGYDDPGDVVGVHLAAGLLGSLAIGFIATKAVNSAGANGLFYGGGLDQLGKQALAVAITVGVSLGGTCLLLAALKLLCGGLRIPANVEKEGRIDEHELGEAGYHPSNHPSGQLVVAVDGDGPSGRQVTLAAERLHHGELVNVGAASSNGAATAGSNGSGQVEG